MVEVSFRYTPDRLTETLRRYRRQHQRFGNWFLWLPAVFMAPGGIALICAGEWFWGLWSIAVAVLIPASPWISEWMARRSFQKSPFCNEDVIQRFDAEGFYGSTGKSEARLQWSAFTQVVHFPDGFLLFTGPKMFYWLAAPDFASPEQVAEFETLLREKVSEHRVVVERKGHLSELLKVVWFVIWVLAAMLLMIISFVCADRQHASAARASGLEDHWYFNEHFYLLASVVAGVLGVLPFAPRRYSLRTVLIVIMLFAVALGVMVILQRTGGLVPKRGR